jgi:hypothetical protein
MWRSAFAAAAFASLCAISCRGIVAGDAIDVAAELCNQLESCYGDSAPSCSDVRSTLSSASPSVQLAFVGAFDPAACEKSCPATLACLDAAPFCGGSSTCEDEHDCCGWSKGIAACTVPLGSSSDTKQCCAPDGAPCGDDMPCCGSACRDGVCGDTECIPVDEPCSDQAPCCSGVCRDDVCSEKDCSLLNEPCSSLDDCCSADEQGIVGPATIECSMGFCTALGVCADAGAPCVQSPGDPTGGCCAPYTCEADGFGGFSCGQAGCLPFGSPCTAADTCCEGFECADDGTGAGTYCGAIASCSSDGSGCNIDSECCSTKCVDYTCSSCATPECHGLCMTGAPMTVEACASSPIDGMCIAAITEADDYCRCTGWDSTCVSEVDTICGMACPTAN